MIIIKRQSLKTMIGILMAMILLSISMVIAQDEFPNEPQEYIDKIVWIGAHADDEVFTGPLLADYCKSAYQGYSCHIVTVTDGAAGPCNLCNPPPPEGCPCGTQNSSGIWSNLVEVRAMEEQNAANFLEAGLTQWNFSNAKDPESEIQGVLNRWNSELEPGQTIVDVIRHELEDRFDSGEINRLIIFDPRHGSTCHMEHRAVAQASIEAALQVPHLIKPRDIYLQQNLFDKGTCCSGGFYWEGFRRSVQMAQLEQYDATATWPELIGLVEEYPSQFGQHFLNNASPSQQYVWYIPLNESQYFSSDPTEYDTVCSGMGGTLPCNGTCPSP